MDNNTAFKMPQQSWSMDHKRTAFMFIIRQSDRAVYFVRRGDSLGAPGGKGERDLDANDLSIAVREFKEETGNLPPGVVERAEHDYVVESRREFYNFVATGDVHHVCTFMYRIVPDSICAGLRTGASPEADSFGEDEVLWVDVVADWARIRPHIQKGINLIRRDCASALPPAPRSRWAHAVRRWPRARAVEWAPGRAEFAQNPANDPPPQFVPHRHVVAPSPLRHEVQLYPIRHDAQQYPHFYHPQAVMWHHYNDDGGGGAHLPWVYSGPAVEQAAAPRGDPKNNAAPGYSPICSRSRPVSPV